MLTLHAALHDLGDLGVPLDAERVDGSAADVSQ